MLDYYDLSCQGAKSIYCAIYSLSNTVEASEYEPLKSFELNEQSSRQSLFDSAVNLIMTLTQKKNNAHHIKPFVSKPTKKEKYKNLATILLLN